MRFITKVLVLMGILFMVMIVPEMNLYAQGKSGGLSREYLEHEYFDEAKSLFNERMFEEALIKFIILTQEMPKKAIFWDWRAKCHLKLKEYRAAVLAAEIAITLEPFVEKYYLTRARAYYELGEYRKAANDLEVYLSSYSRDASAQVLLGLSYIKLERFEDAEKHFKKVKELSPSLENLADYYLGYLAIQLGRADEGINLLESLKKRVEGTPLSDDIERQIQMAREQSKAGVKRNWYASITTGLEYTDNVLSLSKDTLLPSDISSRRDKDLFLILQGGYNLYKGAKSQLSISMLMYGNLYFKLDDFDVQQYQPGLEYTYYPSKNWQLLTSLTFSDYRVDGDRSSDSISFSQSALYFMRKNMALNMNYTGTINEFAGDTTSDEDRDGNYHSLEVFQSFGFQPMRILLDAGLRYGWNNTDGKEYDSDSWSFFTTMSHNFIYRSRIKWDISYTKMEFDNPSLRASPAFSYSREDKTYTGSVTWMKSITEKTSTSIVFTYLDNDSNITAYDYDKYSITLSFTYRFN